MANYAVVKSGVVENMVVWDGVTEFSVADSELIEATESARIGGSWDGNVFTFVEPTPPEQTASEVQAVADKTSGHNKLVALGLTDAEIAALGIQ
jgi:hypothetical protein|tara:strand:- start:776 stop:1057 length:282 start_codon:yes stop_codon:yes gene_type:complete